MRRYISTICAGAIVAACQPTTEGVTPSPPTLALPTPGTSVSKDLGSLINAERRNRSLPPVARSPILDGVALAHARDMAGQGYFSHTGRDGSAPHDRLRAVGYRPCLSAENIAAGQSSVPEVVRDWMRSSGHRDNILRAGVQQYGAAASAEGHWVLVLARPGC